MFSSVTVEGGDSLKEDQRKSDLNNGPEKLAGQPNAKEVAQAVLSAPKSVGLNSVAEDMASVICRLMGKRGYQAFILFLLSIYKDVMDYQQKTKKGLFLLSF